MSTTCTSPSPSRTSRPGTVSSRTQRPAVVSAAPVTSDAAVARSHQPGYSVVAATWDTTGAEPRQLRGARGYGVLRHEGHRAPGGEDRVEGVGVGGGVPLRDAVDRAPSTDPPIACTPASRA